MTYKIIGKYIKDLKFNIPNPKVFFLLSKNISNYKINIDIKRGDEHMEIEHTLEYKNQKYKHRLLREKDPTKTQLKYYSLWKAN